MRFAQFDLNLLRVLDMLLSERNVTRAAENLHVTQQAMSGSLRRLRDYFDDPLLVRVGRRMELTPLAQGLVAPVREALLTVESALNYRPRFDPRTTARTFRIAISDYGSFVIMPPLLRFLAREAPQIALDVRALVEQSFVALEHGDLDFVITAHSADLYGLYRPGDFIRREWLFSDDFVCIADRNHPDINGDLTEDLYRRLPHTAVHFGPNVDTIVERAWKAHDFRPNIGSTALGFATMLFMLPGTILIATAQRKLARVLAPPLNLNIYEVPMAIGTLEEHLFWHERNTDDPAHCYLRGAFRDLASSL
ncbi:LysR family transcriptional regulator [Niveispirillum sp.]|uniref:LysR family transcriptional regulator n=1 Tax=Niveispirillum sp. TaxID=1917217 RepID=UPI001B3FF609|nr:LysR family transcriptional regulator [Niveispirillum sp.]MBP7339481.1 LysR family transcriptional regulator [Niveispirillum sp.]